jgi:predicted HAD superfamily Cof-like phosphohydrolase
MNAIQEIMKFQTTRGLDKQVFDWENEATNIVEELLEAKGYDVPKNERGYLRGLVQYLRARTATNAAIGWLKPFERDAVDAFADIIVFCVGSIMKLGYDPEKVLDEVAKEINSREGEMKDGKFEKYLDDDSKAKWYTADFTGCKL